MNNQNKRACIYLLYDKDGIVDDYVVYQLKALREYVSLLYVVVNGQLVTTEKDKLKCIADVIYERENVGVDIGGYKAALKKIGWNHIRCYDELILMNYTCFGPVYSMNELFQWSENLKGIDFWALTKGEKADFWGKKDYLHYTEGNEHYQSYFYAFKKRLLNSDCLQVFFDEIPENGSYLESVCYYEYAFPEYFEKCGFKGAVYCDDVDINYPLLHRPTYLLKKYKMPFIKVRTFSHHYTDILRNGAGENTLALFNVLQTDTTYQINLIWKYLLRTKNLSDIARCAHLYRVLPKNSKSTIEEPKTKIGVVYHSFYEDLIEESIDYLTNAKNVADILITTTSEDKKLKIQTTLIAKQLNAEVRVIENRGRDVSSLLVAATDFIHKYDLVCFAHDKKTTQVRPANVGRAWFYKLHENVLGSEEYIKNIIFMFKSEPQLGLAYPMYPNHSFYADTLGSAWGGNFENTKQLLGALGVKVPLNEKLHCIAPLGTCFWFRVNALDKLYAGLTGEGWSYSDFPLEPNKNDNTLLHAIERSYAYCAQANGYYSVMVSNNEYAQVELTNTEFNQSGLTCERAWIDHLAAQAIGLKVNGNMTDHEVQQEYQQRINYGIRVSIINLAYAIKCRFPLFWRMVSPLRGLVKLLLKIH